MVEIGVRHVYCQCQFQKLNLRYQISVLLANIKHKHTENSQFPISLQCFAHFHVKWSKLYIRKEKFFFLFRSEGKTHLAVFTSIPGSVLRGHDVVPGVLNDSSAYSVQYMCHNTWGKPESTLIV